MTKFDAAFLSCRVLALWLLVQALLQLSALPYAFSIPVGPQHTQSALFALSYTVLPFFLYAALGAGLWGGAAGLAWRIMDAPPAPQDIPMTRGALETIAFTVIGVFLLAQVVPEVVRQILTHLLSGPDVQASANAAFVGKNWELLLRFLLGVWLVMGAPALSRWLGGIRQPAPHHN